MAPNKSVIARRKPWQSRRHCEGYARGNLKRSPRRYAPRDDIEERVPRDDKGERKKIKTVTIMRKISSFSHFVMLSAVAAAILMASCIKDEVVDVPFIPSESETICFGVASDWGEYEDVTRSSVALNRTGNHELKSADGTFILPMGVYVEDGIHAVSDMLETRGAKVDSKDAISNFNVWAALTKTDNAVINYFSNVAYEKNTTDNVFYPVNESDEYYWPGSGTLDFTAVANVPTSGFTPTMAGNALASFDYTVPTDATAQPDILVANADDVNGNLGTSVPLNFKHIMSAVNIEIGKVVKGEIRSITLTGVYNKATYNVSTGRWNIDTTSKDDYSVTFAGGGDSFTTTGDQAEGTSVNASNATFMFIPQEPAEGAEMIIEFYDTTTGRLYSDAAGAYAPALRGSIAGDIWDMAKTTNYRLSIDESFTLTVEPTGKKLDAHYIITEVNVTVDGIANWQIDAKANDGAAVSIIPYSSANPLAKQGYWTDVEVNASGVETTTSARGFSSYTGSGNLTNEKFLLFIPENVSNQDRSIEIILSSTDTTKPATTTKVLLQKFPNWAGDIGWEVVDDDEAGKFGFKWTRKVAYVYPYWRFLQSTARNQCQSYIDQYDAGANGFATVGTYRKSIVQHRGYIWLDYTVLNSVEGADSSMDGYGNTLALYRQAGNTATSEFETILDATKKSESGHETEDLFRVANAGDISDGAPAEEGQDNDLSAIMEYVQKKNRYCLQKHSIDSGDSDGSGTTFVPYFQEKDLKWFLPAYGQFVGDFTPENPNDTAADYWSSTTAGASTAYIGSGAEKDRDLEFAVIAARVNENGYGTVAVTVDNSEMAGGENGEAQWVN